MYGMGVERETVSLDVVLSFAICERPGEMLGEMNGMSSRKHILSRGKRVAVVRGEGIVLGLIGSGSGIIPWGWIGDNWFWIWNNFLTFPLVKSQP